MATTISRVNAVIAEQLGVEASQISTTSTLTSLGADSLDLVEVVMALEDEFKIEIPDDAIPQDASVQQLVDAVDKLLAK